MTCFLNTKYRNCPAIDAFVGDRFTRKSNLSAAMKETNQSELSLGGQKPLWISTQSLQEDKDELMPILKEETNDYSNDVIWTCSPASDFEKCKLFCQGGWEYGNINHMDGIEDACVVVFEMPSKDNASFIDGQTHLSRLFTRARNCLILITEEKVTRYLSPKIFYYQFLC